MIERYSRPEMRQVWSEENKFKAWLEVEILACEGWAKVGEVPADAACKIREKAKVDLRRIEELEKTTRHDVVAFTRAIAEQLGPESKWVHYGLTSTDVVDTALGYLLKQANSILHQSLREFIEVLRAKALEHKFTVMIGRTHGVHAEPTTFGLKLALWFTEMQRNLERFQAAAAGVEYGKMSGAVGTFANINPVVEEHVCMKLGIEPAPLSTQTLQRDRHAYYISTLAIIASSLDKFATEIRSLQKTETREVEEQFHAGQKGSSAMPHKRNPVGSENICGCARVMRGYVTTALENMALWHERDISHSSAERIVLPDATSLLHYMLTRLARIIETLVVIPENMLRNMERSFGLVHSQQVLLSLVSHGLTREVAYDLVQKYAMQAWDQQVSFHQILAKDKTIQQTLSPGELERCFDYKWHLQRIELLFERAGLQ